MRRFGCEKLRESLFDVLQNNGISMSGESSIRAAMLLLDNKEHYYRDNIVDCVFIYCNRQKAVNIIKEQVLDHCDIETFCDVKSIMAYEISPRGAFNSYKQNIPMVILRLGKKLDDSEGYFSC